MSDHIRIPMFVSSLWVLVFFTLGQYRRLFSHVILSSWKGNYNIHSASFASPMASISSFYYQSPQEVFDVIDSQFTLHPDSLIELTKAFLDEVKIGLTNYNCAMAMMSAFIFWTTTLSLTCVFQSYICNRCSRWHRDRVCYKIIRPSLEYFLMISFFFILSTFLALDLGGTNLWFKFHILKQPSNRASRRVCKVVLNGDKSFNIVQQKYKLSTELKTGEASALFGKFLSSDVILPQKPIINSTQTILLTLLMLSWRLM